MLILPAIDIMGGKCVRLALGRFEDVTTYADPADQCAAFAAQGAEWIHVVDLDGARQGKPVQHDVLRSLVGGSAKIQFGGGVRSLEHVRALLNAGVSRVVVGSLAALTPEQVRSWIAELGAERICCAFDVRPVGERLNVVVKGWTEGSGADLNSTLKSYPPGTLKHVLVTDVSRDGVLAGPNFTIMRTLRDLRPDLMLQASGGISSLSDVAALRSTGVAGAIIGRALYERRFSLGEALAH
ncbi:MAG: 1-(5-phosphoribosyl)-5-[(5-phosphoribosylamino)methylideneamino]imidazole-4-carboxamide isomerase [Proteobacteria bacterium]|nr:1-(5-phosphoribosyl)-5-[(5-phosphoribosylamino)methylideneamino]imidazole-4-carboxamide isomerase [Pseudomonadota bacterium]